MKRLIIILLLSVVSLVDAFSQDEVIVSRINAIKMDAGYLYGEYTDRDLSKAESLAVADLFHMFDLYSRDNKDVGIDSSKISLLQHSRGKNFRVFAYVPVDSLKTVLDALQLNIKQFENKLTSVRNWNEVMNVVHMDAYSSFFTCGVVDMTVDENILMGSYVIVTRGANRNVIGVYCPVSDSMTRKELISGMECRSIGFNKGDTIFWLYNQNN